MRSSLVLVVALVVPLATIACRDKSKPSRDRSPTPDSTDDTAEPVSVATPPATTGSPAPEPPAAPKRNRGTVTIGKLTSNVVVPEAELVINSFAGDLSRCYEDALARAPSTAGRFEVVLVVETTGSTVGAPRVERANALPADLTACMAKSIGSARFRGFAGHRATVHVPITLTLAANAAAAKK